MPLFHLFSSFQTHITIFTTNKCEKCPSSRRYCDSNSQPLENESPPITTRPGLPPLHNSFARHPFAHFVNDLLLNNLQLQIIYELYLPILFTEAKTIDMKSGQKTTAFVKSD